jgi:Cof subfamily protein (haloacid dehalogenase superfamily)
MTIRLVALDLDGTLLDPYGKLTPAVREAVARVVRRGDVRVALVTGRRFRTALPHAQALGLSGAIIVNNGALVKDLATGETVQHAFLPADAFGEVIDHVRSAGSPLVYVDRYHDGVDIVTERADRAHRYQREYLDDQGQVVTIADDVKETDRERVIMVTTMGELEPLDLLRRSALERFGTRIQTHTLLNKNYQGQILEFLSPSAGKWPALERLAGSWGIAASEIAAVGDDTNDAEVLGRVGLGIAMGNALPEVRARARAVVRSNAEGGAVEALEQIYSAL